MPKYKAVYTQTEKLVATYEADNDEEAWDMAGDVFGSTDAESVDLDLQIESVEKVED